MSELAGRVALVTGGGRGIGRAIAIALAGAGADVAVSYRARAADAEEAAHAIRAAGRRSVSVGADVANRVQIQELALTVERELGPVDILINNAGIARPQNWSDIDEADWDEVIDTNLKSCFLMTQAVAPGMLSRHWGRIVNISSVAAQVGGVVGPHYAASKAGMHGLTHYYASRFAKEGITVNAIAPALIDTEMVRSNPNASADRIPTGRFGLPEEVASVALLLARNAYITGQTINVNGGWYMS